MSSGGRAATGGRRTPPPSNARLKRQIQEALSLDLLEPRYRPDDERAYKQACLGHCYVAAEAAYHLYGKAAGFVPYCTSHGDGSTHWWLENEETGERLDPTEPQIGPFTGVYAEGRRRAFLTKRPSKRARELMRRVRAKRRGFRS